MYSGLFNSSFHAFPNIIRNIGRLPFGVLNGPNETLVSNSYLFLPKNPDYATYFLIPPKIFIFIRKKKVSANSFYILKITINIALKSSK